MAVEFSCAEAEPSVQSTDVGQKACSGRGVTGGLGPGDWTQGCLACLGGNTSEGLGVPTRGDCRLEYLRGEVSCRRQERILLTKSHWSFILPLMGVS